MVFIKAGSLRSEKRYPTQKPSSSDIMRYGTDIAWKRKLVYRDQKMKIKTNTTIYLKITHGLTYLLSPATVKPHTK